MELVRIADINGLEFEVVESIPKGYEVWHINTKNNYLPLCKIDENCYVDINTLKCIKLDSMEDVQTVLNGMMYVRNRTPKALKSYFRRYSNGDLNDKMAHRVSRVYKALSVLERNGIK